LQQRAGEQTGRGRPKKLD